MGAREMDDGFTARLAALMAERGLGVLALARRAHFDKAYVSRVVSGKQSPSAGLARRLDEVLGADGELAALAPERGGLAGEHVSWAQRYPRHVGREAINSLETVLAVQRRAEDSLGVAAVLGPVTAHLAIIEGLVKEARGLLRPRLVHVAGQWAQYAGWLYLSAGKTAAGDAWLVRALHWAVEAGEPGLISEVLSFQGHAAWMDERPGAMIGLSQAAQRDPGIYPGQLAIAAAQEAQGHAMTGDPREVGRLLDRADTFAIASWERRADAPPWLYYHSPGLFTLQRGLAYRYLSGDAGYRRKALEALSEGYAALTADEQQAEWAAEYLVQIAQVHAQGGEADEAFAAGLAAAETAVRTGSVRLATMLSRLRASLGGRFPRHAGVAELREALR